MVLIATWWTREEQPLRAALWYNTFAGIFGGVLAFAIGRLDGPLQDWRYMFLIYGSVTVFCGILVALFVPDAPEKAWFLTPGEKDAAAARLASTREQHAKAKVVIGSDSFQLAQCTEALRDLKYWVLMLLVLAQAVTAAGVTNFNPLIIQGFGYSTEKTNLMSTPQPAVGIVVQVALSVAAYYLPNTRCLLWMLGTLPALAGSIMIHLTDPATQRSAALAGVYMMGCYNVGWVMAMALITANTAGRTKRAFVNASAGFVLAVGEIIGPQFFLDRQAPHYELGIFALIVSFAIMTATGGLYWVLAVLENRSRDAAGEPAGTGGGEALDDDITDVQDKTFRYSY
ncbi:major facilitator superfamily domain-containing protein [Xylariomycetidae sp. FL2044]|nr:major facilitator superfamily domain-containing protein [Xylariomycetidae sp. FL2044]